MSEKRLTQEEINSLIMAAATGGEEAIDEIVNSNKADEGYMPYDFNRPVKFNLQNIKSLESIAKNFARNFSQDISASLRLPIQFNLNTKSPIEQVPYNSEYIEKMPIGYYVFCVVGLGHEGLGKIILEFDLSMVRPIHKRLMGGSDVQLDETRQPLTEIERITLEEWVEELMLPKIEDAFRSIVDLDLRILTVESEPQYVKITAPSDMIVLITFDVSIGNKETTLRLCIPYLAIEPIIEKLTTENVIDYQLESGKESNTELIQNNIKLVRKKVDVELGKTKIPVKEILAFSEGDLLVLNNKINQDLVGYISDLPKFSCRMGREGKKVAVKLTGFAKKEVASDE